METGGQQDTLYYEPDRATRALRGLSAFMRPAAAEGEPASLSSRHASAASTTSPGGSTLR